MTYEVTEQGVFVDGVRAYVTFDRGNLWAMVRATDKATFDAQALEVGLKVEAEDGTLIPAPGTTITEMGPHVLTPGEYDGEGNETSPPVMDTRHHVNFWLSPQLVAAGLWEQWALAWSQNGTTVAPNNQEEAVKLEGIELIDPATVSSPSNRLL